MSSRTDRRAGAWTLRLIVAMIAVSLVLAAGGLAIIIAGWPIPVELTDWGFPGFQGAAGLVFAIIGGLIAARRPRNPIGWLWLLAGGVASTVSFFVHYYSVYGLIIAPGSLPASVVGVWIEEWIWVPTVASIGNMTALLFPTGRPLSPRWGVVAWTTVAGAMLGTLGFALTPELDTMPIANPIVTGVPAGIAGAAIGLGVALIVGSLVAASVSVVLRFRRSSGVERQQLKWLALAASLAAAVFAFYAGTLVVTGDVETFAATFLALAYLTLPFAIGIGILRHRLFDIDLLINRALVYATVSVVLGAVYVGAVLVLQGLLSPITGGGTLAVAASTLAVAALFRPVRVRVQAAVDRRFYRSRYDAARTIAAFSGRLRNDLDLEELTHELSAVALEAVRPASVSVWLRR